jgi:hypothetical protein
MAKPQDVPPPLVGDRRWAEYAARAAGVLRAQFYARAELSPREVAATVARALPRPLRSWLLAALRRQNWLNSRAVVPADILDDPACLPEFRGAAREVIRLAVFGLPGQGVPYRDKHRQDIFQELCSQIMSVAVDEASLRHVAARALNHPDVHADPTLAAMVRSFIAQREAVLRARLTPQEEHARTEEQSKVRRAFEDSSGGGFPTKEALRTSFSRLQHDFDALLAQFEEARARQVLDRMRTMRHRFPAHISARDLQHCEEQLDILLRRAGTYRRQIRQLAERGAEAARTGDQVTAAWIMRRLQAIHKLLPSLLPAPELEPLNRLITQQSAEHETQETREEFFGRQLQITTQIKRLAGIVHSFHQLESRLSPTDEAYQRAEANYRRALADVRNLNTDWLSGLVLELEALLDDLEDPGGEMQSQLDKFIGSVRTSLNRLCLEIRGHQRGPAAPGSNPPPPA